MGNALRGRYWIGGAVVLVCVVGAIVGGWPSDPAEHAVGSVTLLLAARMASVSVCDDGERLLVRNVLVTRRIPWTEVRSVGVIGYAWSYPSSTVVLRLARRDHRVHASICYSPKRAADVCRWFADRADLRGIEHSLDPHELRSRLG